MANHRTQAELKPLYAKAEKLIKEEGLSHTVAAREVGLSQGALSRHMRKLEGTFKDKPQYKKKNKVAKKKGRPAAPKTELERKLERSAPQFTQLSVANASGRTLLIITDDQETISSIVGSFIK